MDCHPCESAGPLVICVAQNPDGTLVVMSPQPSDYSTCGAVLLSGAEASHVGSIFQPMTLAEGAQISSAIGLAWAVAFGMRVLIRQAHSMSSSGSGEME